MKKALVFVTAALAASLSACATMRERVASKEDMLAAAGFTVLPANTPSREAALHRLPANHFVTRTRGGEVEYVYADPVVCNCLYVGRQSAYGAYQSMLFQQHLADEQEMTAEMYQSPWSWDGWSWDAWGPGWWW